MAINKNKVMEAAQKFVEKGQTDKAIKEYLKIVEEDAKDVRVWLKIGDLYAKKNDKQQATDTYLKVAEFYSEQGFYLKAVAVFKQILKLDPRLIDVNIKLAEVYRQLGLLSDAMQQYELVAAFYHREGKTKEALSTIRELVELDPENVATRIKLAELYSKEGMTKEAVTEFQKAADYLRQHGRVDDFIKVAERLVWHQPDNHGINRELAALYLKRSDARHALTKLQACFKADPRDVDTLALLASAFLALDQKPKTVSVWKELGRIHTENGQAGQAQEIYRRILTIAPDDADAAAALGGRRAAGTGQVPSVSAPTTGPVPRMTPNFGQAPTPMGVAPPATLGSPTGSLPRVAEPLRPITGEHGRSDFHRPATAPVQQRPESEPFESRVARPVDPPARPASSPPRVATPIVTPPPRRAPIEDDASTFELQLDDDEPAEATGGTAQRGSNDFELAMDELSGPGEEMLLEAGLDPAEAHAEEIAKILTETEVYVKYNLQQKAIDHLHKIFELDPRNVEAREKLRDIYVALGRVGEAVSQMAKLAELTAPSNPRQAEGYLREMMGADPTRARGAAAKLRLTLPGRHSPAHEELPFEDDDLEVVAEVETNTPTPLGVETSDIVISAPAPAAGATIDFDLDDLGRLDQGTMEIDDDQMAMAELVEDDPVAELAFDESSVTHNAGGQEKTFDAALGDLGDVEAIVDPPSAPMELTLDPGDSAVEESVGRDDVTAHEPATSGMGGTSLEDDLDEADFFVSQNLFSEARAILADLLGRHPNHPLVVAKLQDLDALERASQPPGRPAGPPSVVAPARAATGGGATPVPQARKPAVIAKPLGEEDADTHYDLGLAYKEMGLHDEAIKEFLLVKDTPGRAVQCHLMIGLCHLERGKLSDAVNEFKNGLYVDGITERESLAIYFELGAAYEGLGDLKEALYYYEKVHKRDPRFREVDKRLDALKSTATGGKKNGPAPAHGDDADSIDAALDLLGDSGGDFTAQ